MEDSVICPNCGETNPGDLPFCQHCQWRLHSLSEDSVSQANEESTAATLNMPDARGGSESVPDWLMPADDPGTSGAGESGSTREARQADAVRGDDLLAGLTLQSQAEPEDIPEWVARIMGIAPRVAAPEGAGSDAPTQIPMASETEISAVGDSVESNATGSMTNELEVVPTDDTSEDEVRQLPDASQIAEQAPGAEDSEINHWLRQLDASAARREIASKPRRTGDTGDIPSWVDQMLGVPATSPEGAPVPEGTLPEWLVEPAQSELPSSIAGRGQESEPSNAGPVDETPKGSPVDSVSPQALKSTHTVAEPSQVVPPFPPEEIQGLDVDAVLASMEMPDWLADVEGGQALYPDAGKGPVDEEPIAPASLPSWVEAMRPMESLPSAKTPGAKDARPEARGPLLGLQGVLPAIPGAASPSSKPRSHAVRLETSEQHIAHARLLENLLAAETQPAPLIGAAQLAPQNALRWAIGAIMIILLVGPVLSGSRIFPLPAAVPIESNAAIEVVQGIQPDAPVLAVFDYEPATAGEMEATASSLIDHLLLLKHPRLAVISSSATGSALAERFISGILADRTYVRGVQYVNLGFLPGGLAGVRLFAEDPVVAVPLGAAVDRVWDSTVLTGARQLQDFAAIIVITDGLESGRVWIEQTQDARGASQMIVVSSAQAGPMLLPYFDSGQVQGLVAGLNGAAGPELANSGLPGFVRRYWDAYSLGLYGAALLIVAGAVRQGIVAILEGQRAVA